MEMYTTLDEAISMAREAYLAYHPDQDEETAAPTQFGLQKYILQDGEIMWYAEFTAENSEQGQTLPLLFDEATLAIWQGEADYEEIEAEWPEEHSLHEWDEGEFQLSPPLDTEEGFHAAEEWQDDNPESERW